MERTPLDAGPLDRLIHELLIERRVVSNQDRAVAALRPLVTQTTPHRITALP